MVNSGNDSLIVPYFSDIAMLPGFSKNYQVLEYDIQEPWGCPACKLRGPILLPTDDVGFYKIPDCVFYACTGPHNSQQRTANFGTGCLRPRTPGSTDLQSPLAVCPDYPLAEFDYNAEGEQSKSDARPVTVGNSFLTLYANAPADYQMFDILKNRHWDVLASKSIDRRRPTDEVARRASSIVYRHDRYRGWSRIPE